MIIHTHLENIVLIQKIIALKVAHPPQNEGEQRERESRSLSSEWNERERDRETLYQCTAKWRQCATWSAILFWWRTLFQVSLYATLYTRIIFGRRKKKSFKLEFHSIWSSMFQKFLRTKGSTWYKRKRVRERDQKQDRERDQDWEK